MYLNIEEGAVFIADSHFNQKNKELLILLKRIQNKEIQASQIFLMGDMIDFISGESKYFVRQNIEVIELINKLSQNVEIVYLEGNHDYNLKSIFPNINVIKRENQPLLAKFEKNSVSISHGDNFINWKYDLYCKFIRNTIFLRFMNFIDINFFISKKIEEALVKKSICHTIKNFEHIVSKRVKNYDANIIIEGHYHQGNSYFLDEKMYINVPSLCCQKEYIKIIDFKFKLQNI